MEYKVVTIIGEFVRSYDETRHGKDCLELAREFARKNGYVVKNDPKYDEKIQKEREAREKLYRERRKEAEKTTKREKLKDFKKLKEERKGKSK